MIAIPSRHKSLTLLASVVVVQVLLLAAQIKREQQVRLIRVWAVELVSPLQRVAAWSINGAAHGWGGYVGLRTAQKENDAMRAELDRLKIRNAELEGRALEADRLAALLNFHNAHGETPMIAAHVIGGSPDSGTQMINIDRGSRDGIRRDMGVITPDGVVGKIFAVYPDISQVLLIGDKESGVGALLSDTRTQGPVKGTGEPLLSMDYISNDEKVTAGEAILTSGQDRIFPKDLPVGTVQDFVSEPKTPFMKIRVKPAARLDRLEEVLILQTRQELNMKKGPDADTAPVASPAAPKPAAASAAAVPAAAPAKKPAGPQ
ncbi:MAG TPA: rod shape-determining protein MreC [Candidatus Acidoferrales bacterium]|jgi:rod shape-determining protein MreC|nr:rod shape-determining protein MreC [Candidatus Acidoferrales bacterium]